MILALALLQMAAFAAPVTNTEPAKPIRCEKYQHVEHHPAYSSGLPCDGGACPAVAIFHPALPDSCADDMHRITERDWQEVLSRIETLEINAR